VTDLRGLLQFYLVGFWDRRWSIILVAWIVCLVGWLAVATMPDRYMARARIFVDTGTILGPLMKGLAVSSDVGAQVEIMRRTLLSRPNLEQLVRMADLDLTVHSSLGMENLIEGLGKGIVIGTDGRELFQVSYESTDPRRAYRVVDSILEIFVEQNLGNTQRDAESARAFIEKQIGEYEAKLRDAELRVADFRREHAEALSGVRSGQQRLEAAEANLRQLRTTLESAVWRRDQLRLQLDSVPATLNAADAGVGILTPAEQRLQDLRQQLDQLMLVYTERHPNVVSLQSRIGQAQREVAQQGGRSDAGPGATVANPAYTRLQEELRTQEVSLEELARRIGLAEEEVERVARSVSLAPEVEANLTRLTRDYQVLTDQYTQLIQRRESAQLARSMDTDTNRVEFRIIDPPIVPLKPSGPPHAAYMAGVFILGLGAGFAVAFMRIQFNDTVISLGQLKESFGLPVLGSISIVRSALHHRVRFAEGLALGGTAVSLLGAFGVLFYAYQFSAEKPNVAEFADSLRDRFAALNRGSS
jgi:polysaccharide chain length determinant protein (PEP-CTERM system associated)